MSSLSITVTYSAGSVVINSPVSQTIQLSTPSAPQVIQLGTLSAAAQAQITSIQSSYNAIANGTATSAGTLLDTDIAPMSRGSGLLQTTWLAVKNYVLSAISNGTATDAGALTGAETAPISRGAGLLQTSLAKIAAYVVGYYRSLMNIMDVSQFTAGGADDTVQLTNALNWLSGGSNRCLTAPALKTYTISSTLWVSGASQFRIEWRGAIIQASGSMPVVSNKTLLAFTNCTDGAVFDLAVDGNRSARNPSGPEVYAHNVVITDGCQRVSFWRPAAVNAVADGFYINTSTPATQANFPTDIRFYAPRANNSYRNGASFINSYHCRVFDGRFDNSTGVLPMVGVDCEPNMATGDLGNIDLQFYNTRCTGNAGGGMQVAQTANDVTLTACDLSGNTGYGLLGYMSTVKVTGGTVFDGNSNGAVGGTYTYLSIDGITVQNHGTTTVNGVINVLTGTIEAHISNVDSRNNNTASASLPLITVQSAGAGYIGTSIDNVTHANSSCSILNSSARVHLVNLKQTGPTPATTYPVLLQGGASYSTVKGLHTSGTNALLYCNAPNVNIDEMTATNPTSTSIVAYFDSGATGVKVTNSRVQQTGSAVSGQAPWYFAKPPALVDNIDYVGPYFGAASVNFAGGLVGSYVGYVGSLPNPTPSQTLPQFTVANLPSSTSGAKAYATNGLKPGESTGSGTGVEVIYTNSNWRRTSDYAVASA